MKAIRIQETGGPEVMDLVEIEKPEPGEGEVLVKVAAAGINYADLMQRAGAYPFPLPLPTVLGGEVAGTVEVMGPGVYGLSEGTRVVALTKNNAGGYAEYAVIDATTATSIPDDLDFPEATALLVQGLTAHLLLSSAASIRVGESVLVNSAAGGVGSLAIQLAKLMGAGTVVGTASTPEKLEKIRSLGADAAIDYTEEGWSEKVVEATGGRGVDVVLEATGGKVGEQSLEALTSFGRMVVYGAASGEQTAYTVGQLAYKGLILVGFALPIQSPKRIAAATEELLAYVAGDRLRIMVSETFPLLEAAEAHRAMAARKTSGKLILVP